MDELRAFIQQTLDHLRHTFGGMTAGVTERYAQVALRIDRLAAALERVNALHPGLDDREHKEDDPEDYYSQESLEPEDPSDRSDVPTMPPPHTPVPIPVPAPAPPFATPAHGVEGMPDLAISEAGRQAVSARANRSVERGNEILDPTESAEATLASLEAPTYPLIATRNAAFGALLTVIFEKGLEYRKLIPPEQREGSPVFTTGTNQRNIEDFQRFIQAAHLNDRAIRAMEDVIRLGPTGVKSGRAHQRGQAKLVLQTLVTECRNHGAVPTPVAARRPAPPMSPAERAQAVPRNLFGDENRAQWIILIEMIASPHTRLLNQCSIMPWYSLSVVATLSLILSELLPFCNCLEANGIFHGILILTATLIEWARKCIHKEEKPEDPPPSYEPHHPHNLLFLHLPRNMLLYIWGWYDIHDPSPSCSSGVSSSWSSAITMSSSSCSSGSASALSICALCTGQSKSPLSGVVFRTGMGFSLPAKLTGFAPFSLS
jgi:hypothetical protein